MRHFRSPIEMQTKGGHRLDEQISTRNASLVSPRPTRSLMPSLGELMPGLDCDLLTSFDGRSFLFGAVLRSSGAS